MANISMIIMTETAESGSGTKRLLHQQARKVPCRRQGTKRLTIHAVAIHSSVNATAFALYSGQRYTFPVRVTFVCSDEPVPA